MFKFDFDLDDTELDDTVLAELTTSNVPIESGSPAVSALSSAQGTFVEHNLSTLIEALPSIISYSPISIPTLISGNSSETILLAKRDLYDARFQLISSGMSKDAQTNASGGDQEDTDTDLQYVEAPSDLVPGVYEGGLKTWECSIDLAGCVRGLLGEALRTSKSLRVLELGCGTAVPSLMVLHEIFASPPSKDRKIEIHLQDYNELVFRLVTLPNVILAWYMSPASSAFVSSFQPAETDHDEEPEPLPPVDASSPGDLPIVPALIDAFTASLEAYGISLRFFSGSWENFDSKLTERRYDVVLTSETIYRTDSLVALSDLMWKACKGNDAASEDIAAIEKSTSQLSLDARPGSDSELRVGGTPTTALPACLVAAKLVYFGVGGGVSEFSRAVESGSPSRCHRGTGEVKTLWKKDEGVKRVVMEVRWQ